MINEHSPAWATASTRNWSDLLVQALICRFAGHAPVLSEVRTILFPVGDSRLRGGPPGDQAEWPDESRVVICRRCCAHVGD